jgi:hypothetical protein
VPNRGLSGTSGNSGYNSSEQAFHVSGWMGCLWFLIVVVLAGAAGGAIAVWVLR